MSTLITLLKRLFTAFRKDRYLEELQEEMDFHVAAKAEQYISDGMNHSDAFKAAQKEFGNNLRIREQSWHEWAFALEDELIQDIRHGFRVLLQNKGWTAVAVLSLALGIGGAAAIFSVFDALLLKSLPVKDPEQLFAAAGGYSYRSFQALSQAGVFSDMFATSGVSDQDVALDSGSRERIPLSLVAGSYFSTLGVPAAIGRTFTTNIFGPAAPEDTRREIAATTVKLSSANKGLSDLRRRFSRPLQVVFALVVLMLLIACANVANLLLAREAERKREVALRLALGVSRARLIRQLLAENLLLSGISTVLGLAIAWWGKNFLLRLASTNESPLPLHASLDGRVVAFAISLSVATSIIFGLAPMWQALRVDLMTSLREGRHYSSRGFGIASSLAAAQVAISLVLLMGAALFLQTLNNLRTFDVGFRPERLIMLDVNPPSGRPGQGSVRSLYTATAGESPCRSRCFRRDRF